MGGALAIDVFLGDDQPLLEVADNILLFLYTFRRFGDVWNFGVSDLVFKLRRGGFGLVIDLI